MLQQVVKAAYRFSPIIGIDVPPADFKTSDTNSFNLACSTADKISKVGPVDQFFGVNIDVTGNDKLFDGEVNLLREVSKAIALLGLHSRIAIAPSLSAAWAISRYGASRLSIVTPKGLKKALAKLPVAALRLATAQVQSLAELHITEIEQLINLPRASLLSRFGPALLKRLDQTWGVADEPLVPIRFCASLKVTTVFNGPVLEQETIFQAFSNLLDALLKRLNDASQKASQLLLEIKTVDRPATTQSITLSFPSDNRKHIWSLLRLQLEKQQLGFGAESVGLGITRTENIAAVPAPYLEVKTLRTDTPTTDRRFGELLDILSEHLGAEEVLRLDCKESHIPERAFFYSPLKTSVITKQRPSDTMPAPNLERPSVLFYNPSPVKALAVVPDSPPFSIEWRSNRYRITKGIGPERIAPEWWGKDDLLCRTRDYFRVQLLSGTWLWIYRELETSNWFLHGIWT